MTIYFLSVRPWVTWWAKTDKGPVIFGVFPIQSICSQKNVLFMAFKVKKQEFSDVSQTYVLKIHPNKAEHRTSSIKSFFSQFSFNKSDLTLSQCSFLIPPQTLENQRHFDVFREIKRKRVKVKQDKMFGSK